MSDFFNIDAPVVKQRQQVVELNSHIKLQLGQLAAEADVIQKNLESLSTRIGASLRVGLEADGRSVSNQKQIESLQDQVRWLIVCSIVGWVVGLVALVIS